MTVVPGRFHLRLPAAATRLLLALAAGATAVPAFAPFHFWPLALVSSWVLLVLWRASATPLQAFAIGFTWGLGVFVTGVSWIFVSLNVYGNMPAALAALATLLFCLYLAVFPGLAGALQAWLARRLAISTCWKLAAVAPASLVLLEYARGWFLSGFPWLTLGYSQAPDGWLAGFAPLVGVHGISLALAVTAGVLALPWTTLRGRARIAFAAGLAALWLGGMLAGKVTWTEVAGKPTRAALLQGNVPQHLKWREDERAPTLANYDELMRSAKARLIVMPETALPDFLDRIPVEYIDAIKRHGVANGIDVLIGAPIATRIEGATAFAYANSVISVGASMTQRYDKQHLVAFGEFIPPTFSWVYRWLQIPLAGFTAGSDSQQPMAIAGLKVALNICYEDAFGREIARQLPQAELLVNVSNMAWYGRSLAADQHAQFSQMRAIETGRWMLRATNTGVTAAIDDRGRIVKSLTQFSRGALEVDFVPRKGATPYVRFKDGPALALMAVLLIAGTLLGRARLT